MSNDESSDANDDMQHEAEPQAVRRVEPCADCGARASDIHQCLHCNNNMHAFCGMPLDDEGFGQARICASCMLIQSFENALHAARSNAVSNVVLENHDPPPQREPPLSPIEFHCDICFEEDGGCPDCACTKRLKRKRPSPVQQ